MTADVLGPSQIRIHPGSVTQEQAIAEAAAVLESAGAVTGDYLAAMLERERTVSTYMGNELAIRTAPPRRRAPSRRPPWP